mmetsp:Transcript_139401/g.242440  ORF Transcript_139401/g.242440 Transcript_139401/m.242440 type:complete len:362 (-) Transcript_139401:1130-2215(-)
MPVPRPRLHDGHRAGRDLGPRAAVPAVGLQLVLRLQGRRHGRRHEGVQRRRLCGRRLQRHRVPHPGRRGRGALRHVPQELGRHHPGGGLRGQQGHRQATGPPGVQEQPPRGHQRRYPVRGAGGRQDPGGPHEVRAARHRDHDQVPGSGGPARRRAAGAEGEGRAGAADHRRQGQGGEGAAAAPGAAGRVGGDRVHGGQQGRGPGHRRRRPDRGRVPGQHRPPPSRGADHHDRGRAAGGGHEEGGGHRLQAAAQRAGAGAGGGPRPGRDGEVQGLRHFDRAGDDRGHGPGRPRNAGQAAEGAGAAGLPDDGWEFPHQLDECRQPINRRSTCRRSSGLICNTPTDVLRIDLRRRCHLNIGRLK